MGLPGARKRMSFVSHALCVDGTRQEVPASAPYRGHIWARKWRSTRNQSQEISHGASTLYMSLKRKGVRQLVLRGLENVVLGGRTFQTISYVTARL